LETSIAKDQNPNKPQSKTESYGNIPQLHKKVNDLSSAALTITSQ
jgi:hypothetical protein